MASKAAMNIPPLALMSSIFLLLAASINGGELGIYWGQNGTEGTLTATCETGNFSYVTIAYLNKFGTVNPPPEINLDSHCNPANSGCICLSYDIKSCQAKGVKVLLSIGGPGDNYELNSDDDATDLSNYLWNHFLGGNITSSSRPFGDAVLDGIDFDIQSGGNLHYDDLARYLSNHFSAEGNDKKYYLTAAPRCPYHDHWLESAIDTGHFDNVWPKFFNNTDCDYGSDGDFDKLEAAWKDWTSDVPEAQVFLGLAAAKAAVESGFIPAKELINKVLPAIKKINSNRYGGVMLWTRSFDEQTKYSSDIKSHV